MTVEVTSLSLNVKSDSVSKGASRLDKLRTSATKAERSTDKFNKTATKGTAATKAATAATKKMATATSGLGTSLKSALGPLLAMIGPMLALKKAFSTTIELQNFQAQLKTATGSVEAAAQAFETLEGFASQTPYALEQSLEAFIKLKNLGLDPSEKALRSYGNTASAMGKDLSQLIEAVADATTGEFERLKEFGIKSKSEGDRVSFTFRGLTTTVGKNAAEIEKYLQDLGENEFAGAMSDRMDTLGGKVSNLGDSFNKLFRSISQTGLDSVFVDAVETAIDLLEEMNAMIESNQFENEMRSWIVGVEGWGRAFADTLDIINTLLNENRDDSKTWFDEFLYGIKILPSSVHLLVKTLGEAMIAFGSATAEVVNMFDVLKGSATRSFSETKGMVENSIQAIKSSFEQMDQATKKNIESWDRETARVKMFSDAAKSAREEYDKMLEAKRRARQEDAAWDAALQATFPEYFQGDQPTATSGGSSFISAEVKPKRGKGLTNEYKEKLEIERDHAAKLVEINEDKNKKIIASDYKREQAAGNIFAALAALEQGESEKSAQRHRAFSITAATISTYAGAAQAYNDPDVPNSYLRMANAAAIVASGLAQVQNIKQAGSYATGGIVPGSSFSGDRMNANVNSGEMILNRAQQARLFGLAEGKTTTSNNGGIALNVMVENYGSSEITVDRISETDVRIIARDVVREDAPAVIAADMSNPNGRVSNALARNTNAQRRRN